MTATHLMDGVSPVDHVIGPEHAPVTVMEYGDFECPHCRRATGPVKQMLTRFDQRVRFVFRHFPLEQVHPHALRAAEASECAAAQGSFWSMHDLLFEHQQHLEPEHLRNHARALGLDMARFTAEMDDEIYLQRVREHQQGGTASGVRGTPTFFVNGHPVDLTAGLDALNRAIEGVLRRPISRAFGTPM